MQSCTQLSWFCLRDCRACRLGLECKQSHLATVTPIITGTITSHSTTVPFLVKCMCVCVCVYFTHFSASHESPFIFINVFGTPPSVSPHYHNLYEKSCVTFCCVIDYERKRDPPVNKYATHPVLVLLGTLFTNSADGFDDISSGVAARIYKSIQHESMNFTLTFTIILLFIIVISSMWQFAVVLH